MTIYDLLSEAQKYGGLSSVYIDKMLHPVPKAEVVKREQFLVEAARGKCVLDIGASGPMSEAIRKAAKEYTSVNIENADYCIDIDRAESLPDKIGIDVVIAGEVIEHLSNAGHFLDMLKIYAAPVILTTPNAFSSAGSYYNTRSIESVNPEHVCWYSYHTLKTLVERHGYNILSWYWYNGTPGTAEGLIFCMEVKDA